MVKATKRYSSDLRKVDRDRVVPLSEGIRRVQSFADTKFDQTVELHVQLGIDPRHADQMLRGSIAMPHGTGKTKRVVAFCSGDQAEEAKQAGAVEAGGEDLVNQIQNGWMDFDVAVAAPDMMRQVGKLGRLLGPRGLMPSPKAGTVTQNIGQAVKEFAGGRLEFRNDGGGNVHLPIGKKSFPAEHLEENARHAIDTVVRMKPATQKGQYLKKISVSATMTPGVTVHL